MGWIPTTDAERTEMLAVIGVKTMDDLFAAIPESLRAKDWCLPKGMSEMAVRDYLGRLSVKNSVCHTSFLGGGFYDHFIPSAVDALSSRSEFYTAYTPYQPEAAQGTLQAIYEYQSAVCRLMDLECANASLYDGGTAVFEAATMSVRLTNRRKILCDSSLNPTYRRILETHAANLGLDIATGSEPDAETAAVIVQNPSFMGTVADFSSLAEKCHACKALLVMSVYPVSLGLLKTPGEMGADIAVAEGQSLGLPLGFGGPYLGIMATRKACIRKMPGRIAAATVDAQGRTGYVLTLQAREQHIRRQKAMSNICSNEALCALRALIHLCLLGKEGLREVAVHCHSKAEYLKARLARSFRVLNEGPTFNEFAIELPRPAQEVAERLLTEGFVAGLPLEALGVSNPKALLVAVTEKRTRKEMDSFASALEKASCI